MADNFVSGNLEIPHDGNWILKINPEVNVVDADQGLGKAVPSPTTELYIKADIWIPSSASTGWPTYSEILSIADANDQGELWAALVLHMGAGGTLYFWDYGTASGEAIPVTFNAWHEIEAAIRHLGGNNYETAFKVDGVESSWTQDGFVGAGPNWTHVFVGAFNVGAVYAESALAFIDNVEVAQNNWVSNGGTVVWSDNFNSGNFSNWDSTIGTPTVAPNVNDTLSLSTIYARGEFYIPSANYTNMVNNDGPFKHYVFGIVPEGGIAPDDVVHAWEIVRDGSTLYWQDFFEFFGTEFPITPDTWHVLELAIRPGTGFNWEANCKVDGIEGTWTGFNGEPASAKWERIITGSFWAASSFDYILIDNVSVATNDWLSETGTPLFQDDFETGNLTGWDATTGTPTVIAKP